MLPARPVIGLVGSHGAYGRWLRRFFVEKMGLDVLGRDPAGEQALDERALIAASDVLVFCAPIRATPALIRHYVEVAAGTERGKLWLDITSTKREPVQALLASQAEVVGLHPMSAPPKMPTLKGRAMAVCEARLDRWRPWLDDFLAISEADCVRVDPADHDKLMALVQGLGHALHMAHGAVLRELAPALGGLAALQPFHTVGYELDLAVTRRVLASNPAIYQDIQFENPHVAPMLERLSLHLQRLRAQVGQGDEAARAAMRAELLEQSRSWFGEATLAEGSHAFERLGYLLADLARPRYLSVFLPMDQPGSLRRLLSVFERLAINLDSIHSSRNAEGELHFRLGVEDGTDPATLAQAVAAIEGEGIGRVVEGASELRDA
jgi:prephenate dehydrogenase